jgi:retron-type reverse transcriptase
MMAFDRQEGVILVMLDLSAAFNTVDHSILLTRLRDRFGVTDQALHWIASYLTGRTQTVVLGPTAAKPTALSFGVPQGSLLGPVLFSTYISPLADITELSLTSTHQYADDCVLYVSFKPKNSSSVTSSISNIESCICSISSWMVNNKLKQNDDKTELLVFTPPRISNSLSP